MLSRADNEYVTRTNANTPMGAFIRRFWLPALLSEELPGPDSDPLRVRLLGEDLIAFRDTNARVGLLQNNCPHRGASLFFGRNEEAGLRCVYHGWKFAIDGTCLDMPNEPAESDFKSKVSAVAYPCVERGGVIWTYMGPPELMGAIPDLEWSLVPAEQRFLSKRVQQSNYLQAIEGGIDSSHISFLHSTLDPTKRSTNAVGVPIPQFEALARQLEDGVEPPMATRPDLYRVRSTSFVLKRSESWIEATAAAQPVLAAITPA